MSGTISVDTDRLAAAAATVGRLATSGQDVHVPCDGGDVPAPAAAMRASHTLRPTTTAGLLDETGRSMLALADGLQASLSGFSQGLAAAARAYAQVEADAADRAAAGGTAEIVL